MYYWLQTLVLGRFALRTWIFKNSSREFGSHWHHGAESADEDEVQQIQEVWMTIYEPDGEVLPAVLQGQRCP